MGAKKKKPAASPSTPSTPSAADATPAPPGTISLQLCDPPAECGAAMSVCLHWEDMRRAELCLGGAVYIAANPDAYALVEERVPSPVVLVSVWSSGKVAPGRLGLPPAVRAALGPVFRGLASGSGLNSGLGSGLGLRSGLWSGLGLGLG